MGTARLAGIFRIIIVLSVVILLAGCGGGGGGGKASGESQDVKLAENTKILSDSTSKNLSSVSEDGSILTYSASSSELGNLKPGDIITGDISEKTPYGFLKKVVSVTKNGNETVVETQPASLEDAIEKGNIEFHQQLTPSSVMAFSAINGVNISSASAELGSVTFTIPINSVVLYDADGNQSTTNDQVIANGSIQFKDKIDFSASIESFKITKLNFTNTVSDTSELGLSIKLGAAGISGEKEIAHMTFGPYTVWIPAGPIAIPIVFTPAITVKVGINGKVIVTTSTSVTQDASYTVGLNYENDSWTQIKDYTNNFDFNPPSLNAECSAEAYATPALELWIDGVAGPYGELKGDLGIDTDLSSSPYKWELYGGLHCSLGIKGDILGHVLFEVETPIIDYKKVLAEGNFVLINSPPSIFILTPSGGNSYTVGDSILFTGSAVDAEDGNLRGSSLSWTSNINGLIGTGTTVTKNNLSAGTHTITLTASDSGGLTSTHSITITINPVGIPTTTYPAVTSTSPVNGVTGVATNASISVIFSESINPASVTDSSFVVTENTGGIAIPGTLNCTGATVTFTPSSSLKLGTTYAARLTTAIKDLAGNALSSNYIWLFTTTSGIPTGYTITDLGTLGGDSSYANGINNSGQVVGQSQTSNGSWHAFLYSNGTMTDLGTLGYDYSLATGINNSGQVVGRFETSDGYDHAFLYSNGIMTDLGTLGGNNSYALGINNSGHVVGQSNTSDGQWHAFLYSNGTMSDLGTFGGGHSYAYGINNSSQVVGSSRKSDGSWHAFLYSNGVMTDLGTLGGGYSCAYSINNSGQVAGTSSKLDGWDHAFLYSNGTMTDLGTFGDEWSYALGINNSGHVVGAFCNVSGEDDHAFLYSNGIMTDLNSLINPGSGYSQTTGINDLGQIVGNGTHDNVSNAFLITPTTSGTGNGGWIEVLP